MNKLTLFWNDRHADHFYWWLQAGRAGTETPEVIPQLQSHEILKADLACLAEIAQNSLVELVVDSADVYAGTVNMPHRAQRHLRKAVPYLVEENLAESVDHLFFALGQRVAQGQIPVRAINFEYLQQLLAQFSQAEIKLERIRVDLDLLQQPEQGFHLALRGERVLVVNEKGERWACDQQDFTWLVQKYLAENADEEELPVAQPMQVLCDDEERYRQFENQLPVGRFAPQLERVESVEQVLAASQQAVFNLLQGEFEPKAESSPIINLIKKVGSVAAMVLIAYVMYLGSMIITLDAQKTLLAEERSALWQQAFPAQKEPANPDKALRSFLKTIQGGQSGGGFLNMLQSTSALIRDPEQLYPTNVSYTVARNEIRIDLIAKDLPVLNSFRDELKSNGYDVDMSSATQRGDGYSSRLIIRR